MQQTLKAENGYQEWKRKDEVYPIPHRVPDNSLARMMGSYLSDCQHQQVYHREFTPSRDMMPVNMNKWIDDLELIRSAKTYCL